MAFSLPPGDLSYSSAYPATCLIPTPFTLASLTAKLSNGEDSKPSKKYCKPTTKYASVDSAGSREHCCN